MKKWTRILAVLTMMAVLLSSAAIAEEPQKLTKLPISDEKITLTFWWPNAADLAEMSDPNEGEFFQKLEEETNIHIEWIIPAQGSEKDAFNLLFAGDTMPDIVMQLPAYGMVYRNGQDAAIDDGYFADLSQYMDYAPNYKAFLDARPEYQTMVVTDTGKMYGMYQCFNRPCEAESGIALRQDFLDKLGLDRPVTYDDWHEVLTGFKSLGCYAPLYLMNNGATTYNEFSAGYGVGQSFFQDNGVVKFGPIEEGWKEYLAMMNQWYTEGLLDPDFMARTGSMTSVDTELLYNDNVGAFVTWTTRTDNNYVVRGAKNEDLRYVGVAPPVKQVGDTTHLRAYDKYVSSYYSFSATSEHLEEAIAWLDYFFDENVAQDANYGLDDGRSFNYGENGKRYLNYDFRYSNPEGTSSTAFFIKYAVKDPPLRIPDFQQDIFLPLQTESMIAWTSMPADGNMPATMSMTTDEGLRYSTIMADITTYVDECSVKFITGAMDLNTFDSFVNTIKSMGIDGATAIQQAALDRYNAR